MKSKDYSHSKVKTSTCMGPSIKYVTLFLANLTPLSHFVTHPGRPLKNVTHLGGPPPILVGLVQKSCTNSISIVRGGFYTGRFCQGVLCLEGFVRVGFCPFPFLPQYICYNRKLNITLNFMFHVYDKNLYKRDVTCSRPPLPPVTNCHTFSDPLPLERDILYGRPLACSTSAC